MSLEARFEGSLVLEKLAERDLLDAFWEAVDSDNLSRAEQLLRRTDLAEHEIELVLDEMKHPE